MLARVCDPLEISVKPVSTRVPYALNLEQFPDGRVLMTSGDDEAAEAVERVVGAGMVTVTEVPIRYYPVFRYSGIRCIMTETPPIFNRV
jgi:hypothetical protein